ncbi:hypothetical protein [Methanosphaera sp.]
MKKSSYGGIVVILFVSILALCCGAICGMNNIGEDFSRQIIPTSVSTPIDIIQVIDEKDFEAKDITIKLYIPKPVVKTNNTTTNNTNTTNTSSNYTNNTAVYNRTNST